MSKSIPTFQPDGFSVTAAEPWIQYKIDTIREYLTLYVNRVASIVDEIIFVDLFSGNGFYSLGPNNEVFPGSSLMALTQDLPINRFVLCERDPEALRILKIRINRYFKGKNVILLEGHPDHLAEKFKMYLPVSKSSYKVGLICVVDPFSFDLSFNTMDKLASQRCSFIVPFNLVINERMNFEYYLVEEREKVKSFFGGYRDIERLEKKISSNEQFYKRMVSVYEQNLIELGLNGSTSLHKLDSGLMELKTFQIGFYSKVVQAREIINAVDSKRNSQFELF